MTLLYGLKYEVCEYFSLEYFPWFVEDIELYNYMILLSLFLPCLVVEYIDMIVGPYYYGISEEILS